MHKHSIQKALLLVTLMVTLEGILGPGSMYAQDNDTDAAASSVIPKKVEDLPGLDLEHTPIDQYTSIGRLENQSQKFVLYNVGTGKFLNVGSYWGSHAALSNVPRAFWLQRRSDSSVSGYPSYVRYPESVEGDPGTFAYRFFHLKELQVGSTEGKLRSHVTYNRVDVHVGGKDYNMPQAYKPNGAAFIGVIPNIDFLGSDDYLYYEIDMSDCQGTSPDGKLETILSLGENIGQWHDDSIAVHIYGYRTGGKSYVRVDCKGPDWSEDTHRFGGTKNPIVVGSDNLLKVIVTRGRIEVNGVNCIPSSETAVRSIEPMLEQTSFAVASVPDVQQATIQSATLTYYENAAEDTDNEIKLASLFHEGNKFSYDYTGRLTSFSTTIDLADCKGTNENVLSIGTQVNAWGSAAGQYNIHFYYTQKSNTLQVATVCALSDAYKGGKKDDIKDISGPVTVELDASGLRVNGKTVRTVADDEVVRYLLQQATSFQFGSEEGSSRSFARYENLELHYLGRNIVRKEKVIYDNGKWLSDPFDLYLNRNQTLDIQADLKGCTTQGEGIVTLAVSTDNAKQKYALTFTYLGRDGDNYYAQVDYDDAVGEKDGYTRTVVVPHDSLCHIRLTSDGLTVCGQEVYSETDLLPYIPYDANRVGQVAKFRVDAWGNYVLGQDGRLIVDGEGRPFQQARTGYMYASDDVTDGPLPLFISSRFLKRSDASSKEGSFLAWNPWAADAQEYGSVGVFADRSLTPKIETSDNTEALRQARIQAALDNARWYFQPVAGQSQHLYQIYLKATDQIVLSVDGNRKVQSEKQSGSFYLQAEPDYVLGNGYEPYASRTSQEDLTNVDALNTEPKNPNLGWWKLITIEEYYNLFMGIESDFASMLDLSYIQSDPDFTRENARLQEWQADETLQGTLTEHEVKNLIDGTVTKNQIGQLSIGYDYYSKKRVTDQDYTDQHGAINTSGNDASGKWTDKTRGSDEYQAMRKKERNHGRFMGVEVRGDGHGRFYQEVTVRSFGWYALSCQGLTNVGAQLFIQKATDGDNQRVSAPLHALTASERTWLDSAEGKQWPYDYLVVGGAKKAMPMYNALVTINDDNTTDGPVQAQDGEARTARYTTQVVFYVDKKDMDANGTLTLRLGVEVPEDKFEIMSDDLDIDLGEALDKGDNWTVFDNFHLYFGGNAPDPHLVLNEDNTDLDYLDQTIHHFADRPMHLHRTFSPNRWNTLILPVTLSKADFVTLFGETARLAKLDHLTETTVEFKSETEADGQYLRAYTPYIIWVDEAHHKGTGEAWSGNLYKRTDGAMPGEGTEKIPVEAQAGDFYLEKATLEANYTDPTTGQSRYNFCEHGITDSLYTYRGPLAVGGGNMPLRAYGTLCKNYGQDDAGKNVILPGRPTLASGYVMNAGNMRRLHGQYGTRGFRCWFMPELTGSQEAAASALRVVVDGTQEGATSLDDLNADDGVLIGTHASGVYNMAGQQVRQGTSLDGLPAGIYIVDGMKYLVK